MEPDPDGVSDRLMLKDNGRGAELEPTTVCSQSAGGGLARSGTLDPLRRVLNPINFADPTGKDTTSTVLGFLFNSFIGFGIGSSLYLGGLWLLTGAIAPELVTFVGFGLLGAAVYAGFQYMINGASG